MILDALRKSDRQRTRHVSDRLREGPVTVARENVRGLSFAVLAAAVLLATAVAMLALEPAPANRDKAGQAAEIMENEPLAAARVRSLSGELARHPAPSAAHAVPLPPAKPADDAEPGAAAPSLATLPDLRGRLPELHVDIHAWAEDPRARFVLINLRRYAEGDRLREGPVLRRIMKTGVVLEFEGRVFSLPRQ